MLEQKIIDKCVWLVVNAMNNIDRKYWSIHAAGIKDEILRERVYCYELYHQIRCLQEVNKCNYDFDINAEIDKRGHKEIKRNFNPDMIMHQQGSMKNNYCVIEVKRRIDSDGIKKDFETITEMIQKYNYKCGIFILAGDSLEKLKEILLTQNFKKAAADLVYLLVQEDFHYKPVIALLSNILKLKEDKDTDV
jgi:mRNA deadenylase 3'-5' endonuclease subunit Ccr4